LGTQWQSLCEHNQYLILLGLPPAPLDLKISYTYVALTIRDGVGSSGDQVASAERQAVSWTCAGRIPVSCPAVSEPLSDLHPAAAVPASIAGWRP
jgi:hypothetical protein